MPGNPAPPGGRPRLPREIWVLVAASFVLALGYGLVAPALPTFARSFDVGVTAASLVVSMFAVLRLASAPLAGRWVVHLGELRIYLWGLGIVAASTGACAFAANYWQLLVLRSLGGIGSAMFTVSSLSLLVRLSPPALRGRASGLWSGAFLLGGIGGPVVGGGLIAVSLRAPFLVYALFLLLAMVVAGPLLRGRTVAPAPATAAPSSPLRFRDALRHPSYRAALVANFANGWSAFGVRIALVPLLVVDVLHQPDTVAGLALAVFAAGNAIGLLVAGRITDRVGRRGPVLAGLAVSAVGVGVLGWVPTLGLFFAVALVAGLGSGLLSPPMNAAVADVVGAQARGGTVFAGFQMASDLGTIIGPVVAGGLAELTGYGPAFGVSAGISVLALIVWLRAPETLPGSGSSRPVPACREAAPER